MLEATTVTMLYIGTLCGSHACLDYELIFAELNNTQELAIDEILKSSSLLDFIQEKCSVFLLSCKNTSGHFGEQGSAAIQDVF